MNLNKEEMLLWQVINTAQAQGIVRVIMPVEAKINNSDEVKEWYFETKEEYKILSEIKKLLEEGKIKIE